jgi:hypothetical protein
MSYPDIVECDITDALDEKVDESKMLGKSGKKALHLDMSSFTKSRWTRFLRKYFRPDLGEWVDTAMQKLQKYPRRPFVASYSMQMNVDDEEGRKGHNYGGCLSSLQIRLYPKPTVILYSRACMLDKIGFLDLTLIHLIAKRMGLPEVSARWVISLPFVSAISQVFYAPRFSLKMKGHILKSKVEMHIHLKPSDTPYGPLSRLLKRNIQFKEHGTIPRSVHVRDLSLDFENRRERKPRRKKKQEDWQEP